MKMHAQIFALLAICLQWSCTDTPLFRSEGNASGKTKKPVDYSSSTPAPTKVPVVESTDDLVPLDSPVPDSTILTQIDADIAKLNPAETSKVRFFTLQVAKNVGASAQALEAQRDAFKKILNSLSTSSSIAVPIAIDSAKLIYRVNLDDIGTTPAEFDQVIADHYPFNNRFADIGTTESIGNQIRDASIRSRLLTDVGVIRMDWFNATALLPILYKKFLKFPNSLAAFEAQFLGDDRLANIKADDVTRIGFDNSGVAANNRIIELHDGKNGGYYITYDFGQQKQGQIFSAPLGPKGSNGKNAALEFQEDQISVITTLPNGLFAFFMASAQGTPLDKAPISLMRQTNGPAEFSLALVNGQSCTSCHQAGLLLHEDTLLSAVATNKQAFGAADLARLNRIYEPDVFKQEVAKDNVRYTAAMKSMGLSLTGTDPVDAAFRFYSRSMKRVDVLLETGITERDFKVALVDPEFSGTLNALNVEGGTIARAVFQSIYPNLIRKFKQDIQLIAPKEADFLVTADCMVDDQVKMDTCIIKQ